MNLQGKVALVTGAAKRVGRAITVALAERGARIAIHYNRSRGEAQELAGLLRSRYGTESALFKAELADLAQVRRLAVAVLKRFKRLDVLINNASIYQKNLFGSTSLQDWNRHLDINLRAPFFLAQALGPALRKAGNGKIVNISDWAGMRPYTDYIPYCISKAGLLCLNTALAKALAPEVQVNAVLPGPVALPPDFGLKLRKAIEKATLVKRLGSPEDVAAAALFLIEGSDFITGAALPVDGGRLIA